MSIPGAVNPLLLGGSKQYKIERSLRFNSSDSAFCSRVPSTAGNRRTWTYSFWFKLGRTTGYQYFFSANNPSGGGSNFDILQMDNNASTITFYGYNGSSFDWLLSPTAVFRDPSAWQHFVIAFDTTQATASNRVKWWHNGNLLTLDRSGYTTYPSLNFESRVNNTVSQRLSDQTYGLDSYLADVHFIDGQALTPSSFTEVSATTGQLIPKAYSGTYGTNGFHLPFSDNSTAAALGTDTSGNGNTWTVNNISVAAGSGNDSLVDTPTSYGTDTGAGGEVRGNYATLNPLSKGASTTLSNGNLDYLSSGSTSTTNSAASTAGVTSGKWYWEVTLTSSSADIVCGVAKTAPTGNGLDPNLIGFYLGNGDVYNQGATIGSYGSSFATNDVLGIALDVDGGKIWFSKNGSWMGSGSPNPATGTSPAVSSGIAGNTWFADLGHGGANVTRTCSLNFGQRPFAYTAPSGFKALCDTNLPAPVVAKPNTAFDVALWTGNGSARSITGLNFNPDLVWIKDRSGATDHALYDVVRGAEKRLESNTTDAEVTSDGGVTAFNSDGFSLGTLAQVNTNSSTYVGWAWDGGTSTVTNTQGSITSQVRANASAGFSIVTFTAQTSGTATIGHGLGVAPAFIITKQRASTGSWTSYHQAVGSGSVVYLDLTNAATVFANAWNNTSPTSTAFTLGSAYANAGTLVAYCFAPVAGYSSFGSYTGNGSADGPFVYTGFRPRWLLIKGTNAAYTWYVFDAERDPSNGVDAFLNPNNSNGESTAAGQLYDFLSNGFKLRSGNGELNANGSTYVYAAFAENPFQYARAR